MNLLLVFVFMALADCSSARVATPSEQAARAGTGQASLEVQVMTDKASYRRGDRLAVTIENPLSVPIFALTGQTYCTILTVQRSIDGEWISEGRCDVSGPPGWIEIPAAGRTRVEVKPSLPSDQALAPNRHRLMFTFRAKATTEPSNTVFSPEFVIGDE